MVDRVNVVGFQTGLRKALENGSVKMAAERKKVRSSLYASDYGQCMRKIFFSFFPDVYGVERLEPRTLRIFQNGEWMHSRLGKYLEVDGTLGFLDEVDVPRDSLDVHGRCDGLCIVNGQGVVVEFKSINKEFVEKPKDEHVGQLTWYMHMWSKRRKELKAELGYGEFDLIEYLPQDLTDAETWLLMIQGPIAGEIVYESKQNQEFFHFPVDYDESRVEKVRLWFEQMKWHIDNDAVPDIRYKKGYYPCQWGDSRLGSYGRCPFYKVCWPEDE